MAALRRLAAAVLPLGVFALPPLAVLAPKGLAPLGVLMALAALPSLDAARWRLPFSARLMAAPVIALLAWSWLSLLWAIDPRLAAIQAAKLTAVALFGALMFAGLLDLGEPQRRRVLGALVAGFVLAAALVAVDLALDGGLRRALRDSPNYYGMAALNNGMTVLVLLVGPAALWLWREASARGLRAAWLVAALPPALLAPLLWRLESESAFTAFLIAFLVVALVAAAPRLVPGVMAAALAVGTVAAPLLALGPLAPGPLIARFEALPSTVAHRLFIWRFTAERIAERPWLGWGLDSSRVMPGRDGMVTDLDPSLPADVYGHMQLLPLHPHNAPLQVWLELGFPGALLFAAIAGGLLIAAAGRAEGRVGAGVAAAVLVVALFMSSVSYGIWQTWWLAALWFAAAFTALVARRRAE